MTGQWVMESGNYYATELLYGDGTSDKVVNSGVIQPLRGYIPWQPEELIACVCDDMGLAQEHGLWQAGGDGVIEGEFTVNDQMKDASDAEIADWENGRVRLYVLIISLKVKVVDTITVTKIPTESEINKELGV